MGEDIHVLHVDDDGELRELTATFLERVHESIVVTSADQATAALEALETESIDCVVSDYEMPGTNGLELLETVRERHPELPFVLFTGKGSEEIASEAISAGVTDYLQKEIGTEQYEVLANRIEHAVEKRRSERARRENERQLVRYESIVEASPVGMFVLDEAARIVWMNDFFADAFAESRDELRGMQFLDLIDRGYFRAELADRYLVTVRNLISSSDQELEIEDVSFTTPDGEERIYAGYTALLPLEDGEYRGTVNAFRDVTERKHSQRELHRQNERLERFASVVSHDLRNPLTVAEGHLERLEEDCDDESIEELNWSLDRMRELLEHLLELARTGRTVGEREPVRLREVAEAAWNGVDTADATLAIETDGTLTADDERLCELFENLFRNAIEHGGDDVRVTVGELNPDAERLAGFYVADDGPGVEGDPDRVFELGATTRADGTGFGLAIVEAIAEAHDWTVEAATGESGGARFEFVVDRPARSESE